MVMGRGSRGHGKSKYHSYHLQDGISHTLVPGKVMEQIILEIISKNMKDKKFIGKLAKPKL